MSYTLSLDEDSAYFANELNNSPAPSTNDTSSTLSSTKTDRYGFIIEANALEQILSNKKYQKNKKKESERTKKWLKMLKDNPNLFSRIPPNSHHKNIQRPISPSIEHSNLIENEHLKSRIRKGIPDNIRALVWSKILENDYKDYTKEFLNYSSLSLPSNSNPEIVDLIQRDIDRTFPRHSMFQENSHGQESLQKILLAYSNSDLEVNYCQGMGFIVGFFLIYLVEDEAFRLFYTIFQSPQFNLRKIFLPNFEEVKKILYTFDKLLLKFLPNLHQHFVEENIDCSMFFTEWSMCLYTRGFHFDLLTRIWDIFLYERNFKIIYRVGLGILKYFEKNLLNLKFEKVLAYLRSIQDHIVNNANDIMEVTLSIPLKTIDILNIEDEYLLQLKNKNSSSSSSSSGK